MLACASSSWMIACALTCVLVEGAWRAAIQYAGALISSVSA